MEFKPDPRKFAKACPAVLNDLINLNKEVQDILNQISERVDLVKAKLIQTKQWDTCGIQLFAKSPEKLASYLKYESQRLITSLSKTVDHWRDLASNLKTKSNLIPKQPDPSDSEPLELSKFIQSKNLDSLMLSYGTFRKLKIFGNEYKSAINFEWPVASDMVQIKSLDDLKLSGLSWKHFCGYLCGIQLTFANGVESPLFIANNCPPKNLFTDEKIDPNTQVSKIRAKVQRFGTRTHGILGIDFVGDSGQNLMHAEFDEVGVYEERLLQKGEQIVGVYGSKGRQFCDFIDSLGFIVWKPDVQ